MAKKGFMDNYKTYDTSAGYGNAREWRRSFNERMSGEEAETILSDAHKSPYEILGVVPSASAAEIKKAYRKLLMQWHPDKHNNSEESHIKTQQIIAAYTKLSN